MANIRPFAAYRPKAELSDKIAALPYDVYNRSEAKEVVSQNKYSFLNIDRAETQFPDSVDNYAPEVYDRAKSMIMDEIEKGWFIHEEKPVYYLYELIFEGRSQTGIVGCASIDDYQSNIIKKHENTRADKEKDRINHVDITGFQTGPIFLAYRRNAALRAVIDRVKALSPVYDFTCDDNVTHRVWVISDDADILKISEAFDKLDAIYIADGHHRCASAVKVGLKRREENPGYTGEEEFNYFLSVLFSDDELKILDYNRVVKDLNGMDKEGFLKALSENFDVARVGSDAVKPARKSTFGMYLENEWYELSVHNDIISDDAVEGLDVSIMQKYILSDILGITDPKTDKRIDFVGGIRGLKELEGRCHTDMKLAFSMYPTSIEELFNVADAGRLMPPKSTWFEPKLRSGLFLHRIGGNVV